MRKLKRRILLGINLGNVYIGPHESRWNACQVSDYFGGEMVLAGDFSFYLRLKVELRSPMDGDVRLGNMPITFMNGPFETLPTEWINC